MSYSQYNEEQYILAACADIATGRLLDIGAWHATDKSNTRALIERGWSGVLIEPSPGPMRGLVAEYGNDPRITLVCAAMAIEDAPVDLLVTDDAVTSSNPETQSTWKQSGGYIGHMQAMPLTWSRLFNWYGGFEMISLDAEGMSVPLFCELMRTEHRPQCIVVEHDNRIVEIMQAAGEYNAVHINGTNVVLARR